MYKEDDPIGDHSEDISKFRRKITLSELPASAWILAGVSLMVTLALLGYVVIPIVGGYSTPWDLVLHTSHFMEGECSPHITCGVYNIMMYITNI